MLWVSCSKKIYTARYIPIERETIPTKPLIATLDVDINKRTKGDAILKGKTGVIENAKRMAIVDAMNNSGADVIVDPIFEITKKRKKVTCIVNGFYAKYAEVANATREDCCEVSSLNSKAYSLIIKSRENEKNNPFLIGCCMLSHARNG